MGLTTKEVQRLYKNGIRKLQRKIQASPKLRQALLDYLHMDKPPMRQTPDQIAILLLMNSQED